jgi:hypothetical protein
MEIDVSRNYYSECGRGWAPNALPIACCVNNAPVCFRELKRSSVPWQVFDCSRLSSLITQRSVVQIHPQQPIFSPATNPLNNFDRFWVTSPAHSRLGREQLPHDCRMCSAFLLTDSLRVHVQRRTGVGVTEQFALHFHVGAVRP